MTPRARHNIRAYLQSIATLAVDAQQLLEVDAQLGLGAADWENLRENLDLIDGDRSNIEREWLESDEYEAATPAQRRGDA